MVSLGRKRERLWQVMQLKKPRRQKWGIRINKTQPGAGALAVRGGRVSRIGLSFFGLFSCMCAVAAGDSATLAMPQRVFTPGDAVVVQFNVAKMSRQSWIGLVPASAPHGAADVNDRFDLDYRYLDQGEANTLRFRAPAKPGKYELRLIDQEQEKEVASVDFDVVAPDTKNFQLQLERQHFNPRQNIPVNLQLGEKLPSDAWVGLFAADVPHKDEPVNAQNQLAFQYIRIAEQNRLIFKAPAAPGVYEFRLNNTAGGQELASVAFTVAGDPVQSGGSLQLSKVIWGPAEDVTVEFSVPAGLPPTAWVGLIPSGAAHNDARRTLNQALDWQYIPQQVRGALSFKTPVRASRYDLRAYNAEFGTEVASATFEVKLALDEKSLTDKLNTQGQAVVYGLDFEPHTARLVPESVWVLAEIAKIMKHNKTWHIRIEAHVASVDTGEDAMELTRRRAQAVVDHLVLRYAIEAPRLNGVGYGDKKPLTTIKSELGRAINGRIELFRQ